MWLAQASAGKVTSCLENAVSVPGWTETTFGGPGSSQKLWVCDQEESPSGAKGESGHKKRVESSPGTFCLLWTALWSNTLAKRLEPKHGADFSSLSLKYNFCFTILGNSKIQAPVGGATALQYGGKHKENGKILTAPRDLFKEHPRFFFFN